MARLNNRAFEILHTEISKYPENDPLRQLEQTLVMEELEKLRSQPGPPATSEELRQIVSGTYPKFSEQALSMAAQANLPSAGRGKIIGKAKGVIVVVPTLALILAVIVANLPSPAIGAFLQQNASYLLILRFRSMDDNYQQAIESVKKINSAKYYAREALSTCQTQPHTASRLEGVGEFLQRAINKLEEIPLNDPRYEEAQRLQAEYEGKQKEVQLKRETQENYTSCPIKGTAEN